MSRYNPPAPPQPEPPEVTSAQAVQLLETQIKKAEELLASRPLSETEHSRWELHTRHFLEKAFGRNSPTVNFVVPTSALTFIVGGRVDPVELEEHRAKTLANQKQKLESLHELLKTELTLLSEDLVQAAPTPMRRKIFLVHGHNERFLQETARLLETKLRLEVVILCEQANSGRTIIEKFENYADVGFAVVLLTADDRGKSANAPELRKRARQNVILELGYFLGRLGRQRVAALYEQDVEIPSDYSGVLYTQIDAGGAWRFDLARELKAAGFPVDMNLI